jgi:hypothetical protein
VFRPLLASLDFSPIAARFHASQLDCRWTAPRPPSPRPDQWLSKKVEAHANAVALHFMYYNFVRIYAT